MTNYDAQKFAIEVDIITSNLAETLKKKNADYGNNVDKGIDKRGLGSLVQRLEDKLARFENLAEKGNPQLVVDEAVEDTLLDLAGYAILGYRKIQEAKEVGLTEKVIEAFNSLDSPPITFNVDCKPLTKPQTTNKPSRAVAPKVFSFKD